MKARQPTSFLFDLDQIFNADVRVLEQGLARIDDFRKIVRWDVRCHADGDTRRTVDQQVRDFRRQDQWLVL